LSHFGRVKTPAFQAGVLTLPKWDNKRLDLDVRVLADVTALGAGVMNLLPWDGPTIRAATALKVDIALLFNPIIPA
jgi:Mg2+/citrate symporter